MEKAFVLETTDKPSLHTFHVFVRNSEKIDYFWIVKTDIDSVKTIISAGLMIRYRDVVPNWLGIDDIKRMYYRADIFGPSDVTIDTMWQ